MSKQTSKIKLSSKIKNLFIQLAKPKTKSELIDTLTDARKSAIIDSQSLGMIDGVLRVADKHVRDIMIPRSHMVMIDIDTPKQKCLDIIIKSGHSRFPIFAETKDEILGILHAKDFLKQNNDQKFDLKNLLRPAKFIPESKRLNILLKEFRKKRNHLAVVVDEYGGISGLITIEDVLEQIVGSIEDEFDKSAETHIKKLTDTKHQVNALTPLTDFNQYFNVQLESTDYDTIGGYITHQLGHLAKQNEQISTNQFEFTITKTDERCIKLLEVITKG